MSRASAWRSGWFALCLFATPAAARAGAAVPVETRILITGCSARVNERALQDQLRVELLSAGVSRVRAVELYADEFALEEDSSDVATLRVTFGDCETEDTQIRLGIAARITGRHAERVLALSDVPETMRARAIALALTELLRASWRGLSSPEPEEGAPAAIEPPNPPALSAAEQAQVAAAIRKRARLEWQGAGRVYPQTVSGEASSSLGVSKLFGLRTRMQFAALAAGGGGQGSDAHLFNTTGRVTLAVCSEGARPGVEVGGALEAGWAHIDGVLAGRTSGFFSTFAVQAALRFPAAMEMEALMLLQAGYVLAPVTMHLPDDDAGARDARIGFAGPFVGLAVGLAGLL